MVSPLVKQEAEDKKVLFHSERWVSVPCPPLLGFPEWGGASLLGSEV